jgi:hypothetical protein
MLIHCRRDEKRLEAGAGLPACPIAPVSKAKAQP